MLDLKLLTTFREVAVRGSFSDAAVALDFTQPAVSQHISRLEAALGVRVLERNARGVSLTPAGEVLVRHASALLDAARRAEEAVRDAAGVGRAQVRVAAFPSAAAGLLPGATRDLRARRPDAELSLQVHELEGALDALLAGRVDVAVIVDSALSPAKRRTGVEYLPICDDEMRIAVAADHPLATRTSVALEELSDEPFLITEVAGTCADSNVVLHAFADAGFEPTVAFESEDYQALQGMAASGIGVAMIPTMALTSSRSDVVVLPLRGVAPSRQILAAVRKGDRRGARRPPDRGAAPLRPRARGRAYAGGCGLTRALEVGGDRVLVALAVDLDQHVAVVVDQRLGVLVVLAQPLLDHVGLVVGAPAGEQAPHDLFITDSQVDDRVEVEALGLGARARVAVEDVAVELRDHRADGARDQLVRRQPARGHVRLDLAAELCVLGDLARAGRPRGDVRDAELGRQPHALRAFSSARWREHENLHTCEATCRSSRGARSSPTAASRPS